MAREACQRARSRAGSRLSFSNRCRRAGCPSARGWGPGCRRAAVVTTPLAHTGGPSARPGARHAQGRPGEGSLLEGAADSGVGGAVPLRHLGRGVARRSAAAWDVYTSYYYIIPYALINFELAQAVHPHPLDRSNAR
jgi:hypothetical protein